VIPLNTDYKEILGKDICNWIDKTYYNYQKNFGYITG
jgi:hypothetical protein